MGGGVFLVPLLTFAVHLPFRQAVAISLLGVIATSSMVTAGSTGLRVLKVRLGVILEVPTTLGGMAGGLTALTLSHRALSILFGVVAAVIAIVRCSRAGSHSAWSTPPRRLPSACFMPGSSPSC